MDKPPQPNPQDSEPLKPDTKTKIPEKIPTEVTVPEELRADQHYLDQPPFEWIEFTGLIPLDFFIHENGRYPFLDALLSKKRHKGRGINIDLKSPKAHTYVEFGDLLAKTRRYDCVDRDKYTSQDIRKIALDVYLWLTKNYPFILDYVQEVRGRFTSTLNPRKKGTASEDTYANFAYQQAQIKEMEEDIMVGAKLPRLSTEEDVVEAIPRGKGDVNFLFRLRRALKE